MPRPRTPVAKAKVLAADQLHPGRHANRKAPKSPNLGKPSTHLTGGAVTAWEAFRRELPWLTEADRTLVEVASNLRGRLIDGDEVGVNALSLLQVCLSKLGATPTDQSKISMADDGDSGDPMFDA
jgi:hypothetical protein